MYIASYPGPTRMYQMSNHIVHTHVYTFNPEQQEHSMSKERTHLSLTRRPYCTGTWYSYFTRARAYALYAGRIGRTRMRYAHYTYTYTRTRCACGAGAEG